MPYRLFWRLFAFLTFVIGVVSTWDPPTSFVRAEVHPAFQLGWAVVVASGGLLMLSPFTVVELVGLVLPITALGGWAAVLLFLHGSVATVCLLLALALVYVRRVSALRAHLKASAKTR